MKLALKEIVNHKSIYSAITIGLIVCFAMIPLFFNLPFRDNIYLSWEGAYRMYQGQMPFKDFGMPLGYGYWLLPALSFHLFGPYFFSLIKIQVLINIASGLSFWWIIRKFSKDSGLIAVSVLLYVLSFSFYNFWPWYNHTVIVYEFIGFAFLISALMDRQSKTVVIYVKLSVSAFFAFLSLFTKQDGGAFALMISGVLLLYHLISTRRWLDVAVFASAYLITAIAFILPLIPHEFGYWFNYGQEPHYSRMSLLDFLHAWFGGSNFIKLYLFMIGLVVMRKVREGVVWLKDRNFMMHLLLTLCVLFQASVLQVTSYVPVDGNIYFHSFMVFFIIQHIGTGIDFRKVQYAIPLVVLLLFWWSGLYWKYAGRMFPGLFKAEKKENVVSMRTYAMANDTTTLDKSTWVIPDHPTFHGIKVPTDVVGAIDKLEAWSLNQKGSAKVLNMSEITPFAEIMGYELESGTPLWYHLNVAMFDREYEMFVNRVRSEYYDLVIFENLPNLNNFYPLGFKEILDQEYEEWFVFQAPRENTTETIHVYKKR